MARRVNWVEVSPVSFFVSNRHCILNHPPTLFFLFPHPPPISILRSPVPFILYSVLPFSVPHLPSFSYFQSTISSLLFLMFDLASPSQSLLSPIYYPLFPISRLLLSRFPSLAVVSLLPSRTHLPICRPPPLNLDSSGAPQLAPVSPQPVNNRRHPPPWTTPPCRANVSV